MTERASVARAALYRIERVVKKCLVAGIPVARPDITPLRRNPPANGPQDGSDDRLRAAGAEYRLSVPLFLHASRVRRTIRDPFHHGLVRLGPRLSPDEQQTHYTINREMPDEL